MKAILATAEQQLAEEDDEVRQADHRRQVGHDIRHELSTILMLASVLSASEDVGPESRLRARHILSETRWLDELIRAYDAGRAGPGSNESPPIPVRIDTIAAEVIGPIQLSSSSQVRLLAEEAWAHVDRLAFWRALRNVVGNAIEAAGPDGHVAVRVCVSGAFAIVEVDDDGPGFIAGQRTRTSMGLRIVEDVVASWGGDLEIGGGSLGGCGIRLRLRAAEVGGCSVGAAG